VCVCVYKYVNLKSAFHFSCTLLKNVSSLTIFDTPAMLYLKVKFHID
jgi:hypothetical protein